MALKTFIRIAVLACTLGATAAHADEQTDQMALQMLDQMLKDPSQRAAAANTPEAKQANDYVNSLPDYAVAEMMEIVMIIMRDNRGEGFANGMDPQKAFSQMPPEAKQRIQALGKRLEADPKFNNKANLNHVQQKMPDAYKKHSKPAGDG